MMRSRRVALILALLVALASLVWTFRFDRSIAHERSLMTALDRELAALTLALAELRTSQAGYVAAGQGAEYWFGRATTIGTGVDATLERLSSAATTRDAQARYSQAKALLAELNRLDGRARDYVRTDQLLLASDVIFMEAHELGGGLADELAQARQAEWAAGEARVSRLTWLRLALNGGALAFALAMALVPGRPRQSAAPVEAALRADAPVQPSVEFREIPESESLRIVDLPADAPGRAGTAAVRSVDLAGAADVCVDLARLVDGRDVPPLLERASRVLSAKGVVLWLAEPGAGVLRPSLAHGYAEKVLARLGTLRVDSDNVTSLAYRTMRPQAMDGGRPGATGAIAVPLVGSAGCIGVLAAEVLDASPGEDVLSVARIIAAQFAAVSAPAGAGSAEAAQG
jgi:hypothetical protein